MGVATAPLEIAGSNGDKLRKLVFESLNGCCYSPSGKIAGSKGDELRKLGFECLNGGCLTQSQTGDVATAPLGKSRGQRETN